MRRYLGAAILGVTLFLVGNARGGWVVGLFTGGAAALLGLFLGAQVRGRAMRKAPDAPPMLPGETPLLHGPISLLEKEGPRDGWAYLSDQRLSLWPSDGGDGRILRLAEITELRPPRRRLFGSGPLGIVADGQLWQLKVPDAERWLAALQSALHR